MENKLYSLHISYTDGHKDEDWTNQTFDQAKIKLEQIKLKGYDLIPMFVFGGPIENGDVFLWAIKN